MGDSAVIAFWRQSALLMGMTAIAAALSAAYVAAVGRLLGPEQYGVLAALLSLGAFSSLLVGPLETGVCKFAAIYHVEGAPGKMATLTFGSTRRLGAYLLVGLVAWLPLSLLLVRGLHLGSLGIVELLGLAVFVGLSLLTCIPRGTLRGEQRFLAYGVNQVWESLARLCAGVAIVLVGGKAAGAMGGYAIGVGAAFAIALWQLRALRRVPRLPVDTERIFAFSIPTFLTYLYFGFVVNADMLAARWALPAAEAGLYGAAAATSRLLYLGATPVFTVLFSTAARRHAQQRGAFGLTAAVGATLAVGLLGSALIPWLWGGRVLTLLFGPQFAGGGATLGVMWITTSLLILEAGVAFVLLGVERSRGTWLLVLPCLAMAGLIARYHASALDLARCSLAAAALGALALGAMALVSRQSSRPLTE